LAVAPGAEQLEVYPVVAATAPAPNQWRILGADADWDDENGKVQARIEVGATGSAEIYAYIGKIGYQVTILAEIT
jgi:hypothetical protein